jgi:hypothetical protein
MKKLLVLLTTISAVGLYTAPAAFAGGCNISAFSCNGFGNGNTFIHKTTVVGSHNGNGVFGQNAASAGNGVAVFSSVTVNQSASR